MPTTMRGLLSAAMILGICGAAAPALASDHNNGQPNSYGGPVQTWCDINPDCNGWNKRLQRSSFDTGAPGAVTSPAPKPHPAHKQRHVASDH
jgi:hypothetical protein